MRLFFTADSKFILKNQKAGVKLNKGFIMLKKIKRFLGIGEYSPYVKKFFELSNARSGIFLSCVVTILELWMLLSVGYMIVTGTSTRSSEWVVTHCICYLSLILASAVMFVNSYDVLKKKKFHKKISDTINVFYSVICMGFGVFISFLDYAKGEQFVTLITMTIFAFCFLVWRPLYTILFLSSSYAFFYAICNSAVPASYATKVNLFIVWLAVLIAALNAYQQKMREALKEERLEDANEILLRLSISDEITGIANMNYFISRSMEILHDRAVDFTTLVFLFLDIEHFKNYNEKYGFAQGNELLRTVAQAVEKAFPGGLVARFSNDNFVVLVEDKNIVEKLSSVDSLIKKSDSEIKMKLKTGAYRPENRDILPIVACDYARYACKTIKKNYVRNFCVYSSEMNLDFHRKQYIINNIDRAIENKYIHVYYQPVINSSTGLLCGVEALARWKDPQFGFLMPAMFINTLEEYRQIHKLDMYVLEQVCRDFFELRERNVKFIPASINFSRLDFEVFDLAAEVERMLKKYGVDKKYIHVEITESAITEDDKGLQQAIEKFRSSGYALWLDDFGSGYSGLNVLKEYDFDVMKIDMKFLQNFESNEKSKVILRNIVKLAKEIGMLTLTEGVETEEASEFLKEIGCEKLQGFLFGKPMPREEIYHKIQSGEYKIEEN